ncbi:MAG: TonB protein C-terminal/PEGA domain-containing protein/PEGA domain-containing protein [Verrucomicrobia bacterium]|nr:MAG: TonB protein C-terminal/PEGA domain-containing protein/PEGA domain-containing protein [Verrucomicrobiota bacterium]
MTNDSVCFLEQTDFSLLLARGAAGSSPLRLEALQEVPLADADALAAAVRAVFATESASALCALRPKPRALHLAGADEAKRLPGLGGVRQLATTHSALSDLSPAWLAAVSAREGSAPGAGPWLATLTSAEGHAASTTLLGSLAVKPARSLSAILNSVGAIAATVSAPIWLLEIGELGSSALLISRDGVLAAGPVSLNLDRIAEAVQAELGLKFRGSAIKLFFNAVYDYTDVGPKIAARLAASVKSELAALRGANSAPIALACSGLPAAQHWFSTQLAAALELAAFAPETKSTGLTFATPELEASVSPAWFGFLRLASTSQTSTPGPWAAEWIKLDTIAPPAAPKPPVSAPIPAPVATPAPVSAPAPAPKPAPAPAAPASAAPKPAAPAPITAASIASKPVAPRPAPSVTPAPFPLPDAVLSAPRKPAAPATLTAAAVVAPGREPVASAPVAKPVMAKPTAPTPAPAPAPAPAKAAIAPVAPAPSAAPTPKPAASSSSASDSPKPASPEKPAAPKKSVPPPVPLPVNTLPMAEMPVELPWHKNPVAVMTLAVIVLLGLGGYLIVQSQRAAASLAAEKTRTDQRLQDEIAKNRLSEKKAHDEAEARKKLEQESAIKVATAEAGRQRAEAEARASAAARLANARGTLVIATDPAGAMITVGTLAPRPSPATFSDLKIGKYAVSLVLGLYDTAQLELEVKEDATTDTGVIQLTKILGSLELVTEPDGVAYEVKPANAIIVMPEARRTGRTPGTLTDLIPGDYTVTFVRDGWMPQVENVTIVRDSTAHVKGLFPNGIVKISSKPAGAVVTRDGVRLGLTPLTLKDQQPGEATYQLTLAGYATEPVTGRIVGGQVLEFAPPLEVYDHLSKLSDLDQPPKVIATVQPKVPYEFRLARKSAKINVELTVTRDGSTKDLVVLPGSDHSLAAACLTAAAQWKFRPGSVHGRAANVRLIVPFSIEPTD